MRVCNNEYAQHVKRAHVPVPEPYLLVRGGRCKVEYPWIQTCQGLGSKDACPKKTPIVIQCSLQLCTSFAWAHLQTIVSFLLLGTNGKRFHCTDSPANNSILSFYFVLFWEQMENPLKRRGTQTTKTKEARPGVPLIFWMPLDFAFCSHCSNLIGQRDLLFTPRYIISPVHRSCVFSVATFYTNITTMFPVCSPHVFNDFFKFPMSSQ